jgi:hypothetical protein
MKEDMPVTDPELTSPGPETVDLASVPQQVEVRIFKDVYEAARQRAISQGQALAAVAKAVMFQVAGETPDDAPVPESRPPLREYGQPRERLRFDAPIESYLLAKDKITRSGRSVSQAVEDGLARYAETGRL